MSKEIKVALLAIVSLVALAVGFNFLRGSNVLSSNKTYYATYPNVEGLNVGAPVMLNGIKVGQVKNLELQSEKGNVVRAALELDKGLVVGDSTVAGLGGSLLGSKTVSLQLGRNSKAFTGGEDLKTTSATGIADAFQARALPVLTTIDSTLTRVNGFLNKDAQTNIQQTLLGARGSTEALQKLIESNQRNINLITKNLAQMSVALNKTTGKLDKIAVNFSQLSDSLKTAPVGPTVRRLSNTLGEAQKSLANLNESMASGKGSLGKLLHDDSLYTNINKSSASANALISDLQANPKRYVHFSLFSFGGGKDKKKTETTRKPDGTVTKEVKTVENSAAPALNPK